MTTAGPFQAPLSAAIRFGMMSPLVLPFLGGAIERRLPSTATRIVLPDSRSIPNSIPLLIFARSRLVAHRASPCRASGSRRGPRFDDGSIIMRAIGTAQIAAICAMPPPANAGERPFTIASGALAFGTPLDARNPVIHSAGFRTPVGHVAGLRPCVSAAARG